MLKIFDVIMCLSANKNPLAAAVVLNIVLYVCSGEPNLLHSFFFCAFDGCW